MKEYAKTVGTINGNTVLRNGLPILVPSQYIDLYYVSEYMGSKAMRTIKGSSQLVWRDNDITNLGIFTPYNLTTPELIKTDDVLDNSLKIQRGYPGGKTVGNWSEGSQVFSSADNLNEFFKYCDIHQQKYGNKFTYTLATKNDWDDANQNISLNKNNVLGTQSS